MLACHSLTHHSHAGSNPSQIEPLNIPHSTALPVGGGGICGIVGCSCRKGLWAAREFSFKERRRARSRPAASTYYDYSMSDRDAQVVLSFYARTHDMVRHIEPLGNAGGWSGSRL